ncbi:MAG: hypothetical protein AAFR61_24400 [Bacteroidota bacterium]
MKRREFSKQLLQTVSSYALFQSLWTTQALARSIQPLTDHWAIQLHEYCQDLRKQSLTPLEWQQKLAELYETIPLDELLRFIDFDRLSQGFQYPDLGVNTKMVRFPTLSGLPTRTAFVKKIFGMKKDRAIIPHGHSNMASAHLILKGDLHVRHYEKIRQERNHLIVKPTLDTTLSPGGHTSISDEKDNVHWFIAQSATAFTFDVIMLDLDQKAYDIHNLDIKASQSLGDGSLRAPILEVQTALKKYGKESHH